LLDTLPPLRVMREAWRALFGQFGTGHQWFTGCARLYAFAGEYRRFRRLNIGSSFALRGTDIEPCLRDRTSTTPIEPVYFYQDTWCAGKIAARRPDAHVDVGSSAKTMGLISQFVPVTMVDIRPVEVRLAQFSFVTGSVLSLPFADRSLRSLSSLCVIEHIGLGRYGDPFDARGSEKAARELSRVLAPGGDLYVSVPVHCESRVQFNAHRTFTRDHVLTLFGGLELAEERYLYGFELGQCYRPDLGFGTGMFHLRRV
jgi:hypothetical protein